MSAGVHELTIKAESYDGAVATQTCKIEIIYTPDDYAAWRRKRAASPGMLAWMRRHVGNLPERPRVALFMRLDAETAPAPLLKTIR